jgi:hypothetical protein
VALAHVTQEVIWLRNILQELGMPIGPPTPLMEDNESAARLAENPEFHERSKHIAVKYHLVRQMVADEVVRVAPIRTNLQIADIFTKPLDPGAFHQHRVALGLRDLDDRGQPKLGSPG